MNPSRATIPLIRPHECDSEGGRIRGVLLYSHFNVSYNNAFRILHNLHIKCSASSMFANAVVDSCSTCIRKSIFSLMMRLNTSINVIVQSTLKSDVYIPLRNYTKDGIHLTPFFFSFSFFLLWTECILHVLNKGLLLLLLSIDISKM